jgi:hypothetical protein
VTDYKILDVLDLEPVSNRLRNAVNSAYQLGDMPCDTVLEYSQSKEETIQRLHRLPNIGNKTINELIGLLDKYSQGLPGVTSPVFAELSIPDALKNISIVAFIRSTNCSVRLENGLTGAIERHEFRATTLGDLDRKSVQSLKTELHQVQNLGRKSVEEFIDVLKTMSLDSAEGVDFRGGDQSGVHLPSNTIDWASEYFALLEKERYGDITIAEIVRKTPGRSKVEEKLLKTLDQEYADIPLTEVLASSSGELDEISRKLVKDEKLSPQLASLIMDFYRFLSSKNNKNFSHEEYFTNDFSALNEKESKVLLSRFGTDKLTLEEVGKEFGVTRERIRQIESKALTKYIRANRVGLLNLSENLKKYVKASKGVLSTDVIKNLYGISKQKLEVALIFVVPEHDESWISRDGEFIVSSDFNRHQDAIFGKIEASIYRQVGCGDPVTLTGIDGVNSQIARYFLYVHYKKFSMNADGEIELVTSSASERARIVLATAGQPIHTSEATRLYQSIFKEEITEHTLGSTFNRLPDGLILGPGVYALYSHLRLSTDDIESLRGEAYELIQGEGRYLSSRIIFKHICRIRPDLRRNEPRFNYYLVHGVLQDDGRFRIRRGFMVGLPSFEDYLPLESEVEELVETHGPVSITDVIDLLRPTRGELTNGSVRNTLIASDEIFLTSEKRKWDVAERVFNDASDIRKLIIAIRLAAYREKVALSSIYNRIRSTGINYGIGTILSVVWKDQEIKQDGDYVGFFGTDAEIESYYATGEPKTFSQLDYRNYSEEKSIDTGILEALVKEFDLSV